VNDRRVPRVFSIPAGATFLPTLADAVLSGVLIPDFVWNGDPLEVTSAADQVWIGGRAIEMRSRQTELRDRYLHRTAAR